MTSEQTRDAIVTGAEDKKANYVTVIDLRGKTLIADFFIICSGTSNIHIRAVADGIMEEMENRGVRQRRIEGYSEASWVLLDYGDVIVHIMAEEQRDFYKLEALWAVDPANRPLDEPPVKPKSLEMEAHTESEFEDEDVEPEDE